MTFDIKMFIIQYLTQHITNDESADNHKNAIEKDGAIRLRYEWAVTA